MAHNGKLMTVPAQSGSHTWRVITEPISYQVTTTTGSTEQVNGTLVVGVDLGDINATIGRLAAADLIVGAIIVGVLALVGVAVVRANLQPLVEIEETAEEIADGHLNRRVPEHDPRTEIGSLGRSLNIMLSQIETAFHAREESEAAAHQSEERMRRFIADASHELRTPLTAIRGFAEYYRQRGGLVPHWDTSASASRLRRMRRAAAPWPWRAGSRRTTWTGSCSGWKRKRPGWACSSRTCSCWPGLTSSARWPGSRSTCSRWPPTRSTTPGCSPRTRTIDLSVQPGAAFLVIGDDARLRQVIGNLMSNALTHTPDGSPIEVSIGSGTLDPRVPDSAPAVTLDVTDHGPGMNPEQAHRVFERFYRADQARTRTSGGSGLGLAIVRALVTAHGGVASVRTAPGRGATFRIALPLDPEAQGGMTSDDDPDLDEPGQVDETGFAPGLIRGCRFPGGPC